MVSNNAIYSCIRAIVFLKNETKLFRAQVFFKQAPCGKLADSPFYISKALADNSKASFRKLMGREEGSMTLYEKLLDLKYRRGVPTHELAHRYPDQLERVSEVALLDIPAALLRQVVREKELLERLLDLKKKLRNAA